MKERRMGARGRTAESERAFGRGAVVQAGVSQDGDRSVGGRHGLGKAGQDTNRTGRRPAWVLAALLLVLAGCSSTGTVRLETPYGGVEASDAAEAQWVAAQLALHHDAIRAMLPSTRDIPVDVQLVDFEADPALRDRPGIVGLAAPDAQRIRLRAGLDHDQLSYVMAHELVHALIDDDWASLPAIMKEGLCDAVALRLVPEASAYIRARRLFDASFAFGGDMSLEILYFEPTAERRARLVIPLDETSAADVRRRTPLEALAIAGRGMHLSDKSPDADALYGYGLVIVERIALLEGDFDVLADMSRTASSFGHEVVPAEWVLAAADLGPDRQSWSVALRAAVSAAELAQQFDYAEGPLTATIVSDLRLRFPDFTGPEFLARSLPTIGWAHDDVRLPIGELAGLRTAILESWAAHPPVPLEVGRGGWFSSRDGVHMTSVVPPSASDPWHVVHRVRLSPETSFRVGEMSGPGMPAMDDAIVEAYLRLGVDDEGSYIVSSLPMEFASFQVEVDGNVIASLGRDVGVVALPQAGSWSTLVVRLPGRARWDVARVYHEDANVVVSQSVADAPEVRVSMRVPFVR